ncbi:Lrp/AsnC family transcriptional regulator [Agrobacterium tumefaciens]|uniref:Lrp/AsnC family transcriptional regulator n=1 Tax=Agrobacterium tumefaciens TaxID=358 RepID=UPI00122FEA8D|nr:Lrp/AsnC family transcriptional regulator [Agrobacterium tumefaciens]
MKRIIDRSDEKILSELTRNARIPHAELAEKINLSRNAVRQRIERLERDGLIQGYTIVAGDGRPHATTITAMIFVYRQDRMRGGEVIQLLKRLPEVISCDVMSGEFDLVVRVEATDADRIRQIWQEVSTLPGVQDTLTAFALSSVVKRR